MCLNTLSVRWDGRLFDCDFNLVQDLEIKDLSEIASINPYKLEGRAIRTAEHCFACTAGCGSSCGGELV